MQNVCEVGWKSAPPTPTNRAHQKGSLMMLEGKFPALSGAARRPGHHPPVCTLLFHGRKHRHHKPMKKELSAAAHQSELRRVPKPFLFKWRKKMFQSSNHEGRQQNLQHLL